MTSQEERPKSESKGKRKAKRLHKPRAEVSEMQVSKLHTLTLVSPSTVRRWAKGYPVTGPTLERLSKAAAQLGVKLVP